MHEVNRPSWALTYDVVCMCVFAGLAAAAVALERAHRTVYCHTNLKTENTRYRMAALRLLVLCLTIKTLDFSLRVGNVGQNSDEASVHAVQHLFFVIPVFLWTIVYGIVLAFAYQISLALGCKPLPYGLLLEKLHSRTFVEKSTIGLVLGSFVLALAILLDHSARVSVIIVSNILAVSLCLPTGSVALHLSIRIWTRWRGSASLASIMSPSFPRRYVDTLLLFCVISTFVPILYAALLVADASELMREHAFVTGSFNYTDPLAELVAFRLAEIFPAATLLLFLAATLARSSAANAGGAPGEEVGLMGDVSSDNYGSAGGA